MATSQFRGEVRAPDVARFNEPAGLAAAEGKLYVADTNNNSIRVIDLASGSVGTLNVHMKS